MYEYASNETKYMVPSNRSPNFIVLFNARTLCGCLAFQLQDNKQVFDGKQKAQEAMQDPISLFVQNWQRRNGYKESTSTLKSLKELETNSKCRLSPFILDFSPYMHMALITRKAMTFRPCLWCRWGLFFPVRYDYRTGIRSVLLYNAKHLAIKMRHSQNLSITEMCMFRQIYSKSRRRKV